MSLHSMYINGTSNNGGSFADELYNQFLVCPLCSQFYRQPKILSCQHTFCADCIESHYEMDENDRPYRFLLSHNRDISCPVCRARTPLPTSGIRRLPDNFIVANLADVLNRRKPNALNKDVCDICTRMSTSRSTSGGAMTSLTSGTGERVAVLKCLDCVKMLCVECAEHHRRTKVTAAHGLYNIGVEQDVECKVHKNEILRFYCEPCETCICVLCTFHDHKEHEVTSMVEGLQHYKESFETLLDDCRRQIDSLRNQLRLIESCEKGLRLAEDHIRDAAIDSIAAVRQRERQLLVDLRQAVGEKTFEFIADRKSLEDQLAGLEGAFTMTEKMMRGSSVELLMLKKEMLGKLNTALEVKVKPTPEGLCRTVQLLPDDCFADVSKSELFALSGIESEAGDDDDRSIEVEVQTDELESTGVETSTTDDGIIVGEVACTQTADEDFDSRQVIYVEVTAPFVEHVELSPAAPTAPTMAPMPQTTAEQQQDATQDVVTPLPKPDEHTGGRRDQRRLSLQGRWQMEKSNSLELVSPPSTPSTGPRHIPNFSRPKPAAPVFVDQATGMEPKLMAEMSTGTPKTVTCEKETSTAYVLTMHKNVATENQAMVDKCTSTSSDVTAAYRNLTSSRQTISVSRGTSTAVRMSDRATSPIGSTSGSPTPIPHVSKIPTSPTSPLPVQVTSLASSQISIRIEGVPIVVEEAKDVKSGMKGK